MMEICLYEEEAKGKEFWLYVTILYINITICFITLKEGGSESYAAKAISQKPLLVDA